MGAGERIAAGVFAGVGAAGGALGALPAEQSYHNQQMNENIPAIVQEAPENNVVSSSLEDGVNNTLKEHYGDRFTANVPEEYQESKPDVAQNLGELGGNMENLASAGAGLAKAKENAEETGNDIAASRPPEYGDHPPEQEVGKDYGYDYGIGM